LKTTAITNLKTENAITNHKSQIIRKCFLPTADRRLPTADCLLPTADRLLPTADR
jgi:hypothetical protein